MPNIDSPMGLRAVKHLNGSPYNGQFNSYSVKASGAPNGIFVGDAVKLATDADANGVPYVTSVTANTDTIVGVCVGRLFDPDNLTLKYLPANIAGTIFVADSPDLIFEIQEDGTSAVANVNLNASLVNFTSGSTTTGVSGMELQTSSVATTNTLQLHIMGYVQRSDNDVAAANGKVLVMINKHQYANQQTGV